MILNRFRLTVWAIVLGAVFVVASTFIPRTEFLSILNGIFLGIVVAALIVYSPLVWFTFRRKNKLDRVSQLAIGIGLLFASVGGQRLYWIIWNASGSPPSWSANPFLQAMAYIAVIGGALFVTAPGYPSVSSIEPIELWGANRKLLLTLGAVGGAATFILSLYTGGNF